MRKDRNLVNEWWLSLLARGNEGYSERVPSSDSIVLGCEGGKEGQGTRTVHPAEPSSVETRGRMGMPHAWRWSIISIPATESRVLRRPPGFSSEQKRKESSHEVQVFHNRRSSGPWTAVHATRPCGSGLRIMHGTSSTPIKFLPDGVVSGVPRGNKLTARPEASWADLIGCHANRSSPFLCLLQHTLAVFGGGAVRPVCGVLDACSKALPVFPTAQKTRHVLLVVSKGVSWPRSGHRRTVTRQRPAPVVAQPRPRPQSSPAQNNCRVPVSRQRNKSVR